MSDEQKRRLIEFAETVIVLDNTYGGSDPIVADLARRARQALATEEEE